MLKLLKRLELKIMKDLLSLYIKVEKSIIYYYHLLLVHFFGLIKFLRNNLNSYFSRTTLLIKHFIIRFISLCINFIISLFLLSRRRSVNNRKLQLFYLNCNIISSYFIMNLITN